MQKIIIGIDASRNKSGGAIDHIKGIINSYNSKDHNIAQIHIWSYKDLLNQLPDADWLCKHNNIYIESGIIKNLYWQKFLLKKELILNKCDILFSSDASSLCRFQPFVTLSQDALSFEPGTLRKFLFSKSIFRMFAIYLLQIFTMKSSKGTIFLTKYAKNLVIKKTGHLKNTIIIPHGINDIFKCIRQTPCLEIKQSCSVIYISNYSMYKNQWNVVKAIDMLHISNPNVDLTLVGGGGGKAKKLTDSAIKSSKYPSKFLDLGRVSHDELPDLIAQHDIFLFASSCETISITLLEGMASFKPILCSNKGPLPEVLGSGGLYFDPECAISIKDALTKLLANSSDENYLLASKAFNQSKHFTWENCSKKTWAFIERTVERYNENM